MQQHKKNLDNLLSNRNAASIVGTTPDALKGARCTGLLFGIPAPSFIRIGRTIRYKESTLQAWLDQFEEQTSTSEKVGGAK
mgnify:CR=1 FL=1|tara:strand:+ start:15169 stop:15411 length:243 start_codon:yes stop_codon:yes gene_type:complete